MSKLENTIAIVIILAILTLWSYPLYRESMQPPKPDPFTIAGKSTIDREFDVENYKCEKLNSVDKEWYTYGLRTKDGHIKCTLVGVEAP